MAIITLTTDLGLKDYYIGAVKGAILSGCPQSIIVDISHGIEKFHIIEASFILKNAYKNFPPGTIHVIGVNTEASKEAPHIAVYAAGHYFIGTDNGMFPLILDKRPDKIIALNLKDNEPTTFPTRDIFVKAACHIAKGEPMEALGRIIENYTEKMPSRASTENNGIKGSILYIDSYGNAITNITIEDFNSIGKGRGFKIQLKPSMKYTAEFGDSDYNISTIRKTYSEVTEGEISALFNSSGLLEIAINKGSAARLLGMKLQEIIRIVFDDHQDS